MNAPFDLKNIINPFAIPRREALAGVAQRVAAADLAAVRKRDLLWALRRISRLSGKPLSMIPADVDSLRMLLAELQARGAHRLKPKTWSNLRSGLFSALDVTGCHVLRTHRIPYSREWKHLISSRPDKNTRYGLTRFAHFCSANGISPDRIDTIVLNVFADALREGTLHRKADETTRRTATLWNRLAERCPELGVRRVALPSRRAVPTRTPWSVLPASFLKELEGHKAWALGPDPFDPTARTRPLAPRTVTLRVNFVHAAVTALVASGIPPDQITSLAVLVTPENFKLILRRRFDQVGEKPNAFNDGLAKALLAIAREWAKPPRKVLHELQRLSSKLPHLRPGLTDKNKAVLRAFDDEELKRQLLCLPEALLEKALQKHPSVRSLADAQAAIALAILPYCGPRMANLASLEFDRTLFVPKYDRDETLMEFPATEMKNRNPYAATLPPRITTLIRAYRAKILEPVVGVGAQFVFDNGTGQPKRPTTLSWLVNRTSQRHLGIKITGHQFRHILAQFVLEEIKGGHELVKQILGHQNIQTTTNFYAGIDTRRASRFQAELIERIRGEKNHKARSIRKGRDPSRGTRRRR